MEQVSDLGPLFAPPAPAGKKPRYYQEDCVNNIFQGFDNGVESGLVVAATGLGKTFTFCETAKRWDEQRRGRVLVLAHRSELIDQAARAIEEHTMLPVEIEQAQLRSWKAPFVVGSVQTMSQPKRLAKFHPGDFSLVIVDEAHHAVAKTYRRIIDHFQKSGAKVLGVTATPDRGDEAALGRIFDEVFFDMDIRDGIDQGWLVPPSECQQITLEDVDLDVVKSSAGDLQAGQLDEEMVKGVEAIVQKTMEIAPGKQAIAFAPGVRTAHYLAERFNRVLPGSAESIDGTTDKDERKEIVRRYKNGEFLYLCNCMVATEGFDAPTASVVIQARPTKSRSLYAQMIGRVTRTLPGTVDKCPGRNDAEKRRQIIAESTKPSFQILDFVGNSTRHSLVSPIDVLGGTFTDDEIEKAKEMAAESKDLEADPSKALNAARAELRKLAASVAKKTKVHAQTAKFDPFDMFAVDKASAEGLDRRWGKTPVTEGQRAVLVKKGLDAKTIDGISKREATKLIDSMFKRQKEGLATYKQMRILQRNGVTEKNVSFQNASRAIDYIFKTKGAKDVAYLDRIVKGE